MKNIGRLITGLVLSLFALPAIAQNHDVTLFAGIQLPGKVTLSDATNTAPATQIITNPKNAGLFGLRVGHGKVWGGEHTMAFTSDFLDGKSKAFIYNSNIKIQAPTPVIKPYATAGMGTIISWGSGVSDLGTKFAINYGGGLKITPQKNIGVNLGVRGYAIPKVQSQTLYITETSVGIMFAF